MRALRVLLVALLHCSGLACSQALNCTAEKDLQIIYKTFAQNVAAFHVFLELLPVWCCRLLSVVLPDCMLANFLSFVYCDAGPH